MLQDTYNAEHYADLTAKRGMEQFERMKAKGRFEKTMMHVIRYLDKFGYQITGSVSVIETKTGKIWTSRRNKS